MRFQCLFLPLARMKVYGTMLAVLFPILVSLVFVLSVIASMYLLPPPLPLLISSWRGGTLISNEYSSKHWSGRA